MIIFSLVDEKKACETTAKYKYSERLKHHELLKLILLGCCHFFAILVLRERCN
jgi:hypothetical protein